MFKRKAFEILKEWKEKKAPNYSVLLEGARRVGKSTIAEEFAKQEYKTYIKVDFANINKETLEVFDDIANLDIFFLRLQAATGITLHNRESVIIFDEIQLMPKVRQIYSKRDITISKRCREYCNVKIISDLYVAIYSRRSVEWKPSFYLCRKIVKLLIK